MNRLIIRKAWICQVIALTGILLCLTPNLGQTAAEAAPITLSGPIEALPENLEVESYCACLGEKDRLGIAWAVQHRTQMILLPSGEYRPKPRPYGQLKLAVVTKRAMEWQHSMQLTSVWTSYPGFPGAMAFSGGDWQLLVDLPQALSLVRFGRGEQPVTTELASREEAGFDDPCWLFADRTGWHIFWLRYYSQAYDLPDFLGGVQRQSIEHIRHTGDGPARQEKLVELPRRCVSELVAVQVGERFDAAYIQNTSRSGEEVSVIYRPNLLGNSRTVTRVLRQGSSPTPRQLVLLPERNGHVTLLVGTDEQWLESRIADGTCSDPAPIPEARDLGLFNTTAAIDPDGRVLLMGLTRKTPYFYYTLRENGKWSPLRKSRLRVPGIGEDGHIWRTQQSRGWGKVRVLSNGPSQFALVCRGPKGVFYAFFSPSELLPEEEQK